MVFKEILNKVRKNKRFHFPLFLLKNYLKWKNTHARLTNIALFHQGRCGSTILGDLLDQHTDIVWASEIFEDLKKEWNLMTMTINEMSLILNLKAYRHKTKFFGFETKTLPEYHLDLMKNIRDVSHYIEFLIQNNFSKFIILKRKNYLRRAVSDLIGQKTDIWHSNTTNVKVITVKIDITKYRIGNTFKPLLQHFYDLDRHYEFLQNSLIDHELLLLSYEDDIMKDPFIAYRKSCEFIGVDTQHPMIRFSRTNPFPITQMVENFNELRKALQNTPYEWMLFDD